MPFEPIFDEISVEQKKREVKDKIKVECKTEVLTEQIKKIFNLSVRTNTVSPKVSDGQIDYGGKIRFFICYETVDGEIKKCECGAEFSGVIKDNAGSNSTAVSSVLVEKSESDISGLNLTVTAYLTVNIGITEKAKYRALTGGENLILKNSETERVKGFGLRENAYPIDEEFEFSYKIKEVLDHRADAVVTAVQCGVGTIIVDGEVFLSAILLQSGEKKDIIRENKTLPFRAEIECEEAMPSCIATARVYEKSFKTDINVDEERGVSTVKVSLILSVRGEAFVLETATFAGDVFSLTDNLSAEYCLVDVNKPCEIRSSTSQISGRSAVDEIPVGATVLQTGNERVEILSTVKGENGLTVTGVLYSVLYMSDSENKLFTRKTETAFETTVECEISESSDYTVYAVAENPKTRIVSSTETETEADIVFTLYRAECFQYKIINDIKSVGEKKTCDSALSVYIALSGEELWDLSKRLNISPDSVAESNPELEFPLTGKERIVVYRKK